VNDRSGRTAAKLRGLLLICGALVLIPTACRSSLDATGSLPRGTLAISRGGRTLVSFDVQLALTTADQMKGLMGVKHLDGDRGMAFLWSTPVRYGFYMKDTLIPLDIAFWDEGLTIVDILQMPPCTADPCELFTPSTEYVGAIEVNQGVMGQKGVRIGDKVELKS
jgi:uncharacterized membrane protein (UPF0127 family)